MVKACASRSSSPPLRGGHGHDVVVDATGLGDRLRHFRETGDGAQPRASRPSTEGERGKGDEPDEGQQRELQRAEHALDVLDVAREQQPGTVRSWDVGDPGGAAVLEGAVDEASGLADVTGGDAAVAAQLGRQRAQVDADLRGVTAHGAVPAQQLDVEPSPGRSIGVAQRSAQRVQAELRDRAGVAAAHLRRCGPQRVVDLLVQDAARDEVGHRTCSDQSGRGDQRADQRQTCADAPGLGSGRGRTPPSGLRWAHVRGSRMR